MNNIPTLKESRELKIFEQIDYKFKNPKLLEQAFTSQSAITYKKTILNESYQRLEFLGDTILKLVITELIFKIYPGYNEGQLTKAREELEKNKALSIISKKMGLLEFVIKQHEKNNYKLEADIIESIIGAIMVDSNFDYKITRYHTLLLIRENVEKDIDLDLFIDYVDYCKNEITYEKNNITTQLEEKELISANKDCNLKKNCIEEDINIEKKIIPFEKNKEMGNINFPKELTENTFLNYEIINDFNKYENNSPQDIKNNNNIKNISNTKNNDIVFDINNYVFDD